MGLSYDFLVRADPSPLYSDLREHIMELSAHSVHSSGSVGMSPCPIFITGLEEVVAFSELALALATGLKERFGDRSF